MLLPRYIKNTLRGAVVLGAVILITSLSVDATDSFRTSQSALGIFARYATTPGCPSGMRAFTVNDTAMCIDTYENGVGPDCVIGIPSSDGDTTANINDANCSPVSLANQIPWRYVSQVQATQLCARAHKRLPTTLEWFTAAAGTPDGAENCTLTSSLQPAGSQKLCQSGIGVFDMIGNVWEFVSDEVVDGVVAGQPLPAEGYVQEIQKDGLPRKTSSLPAAIYNGDYFWATAKGTFAIMRGGFYGSGSDGGVYSSHAGVIQSFSSAASGFRCVVALTQ